MSKRAEKQQNQPEERRHETELSDEELEDAAGGCRYPDPFSMPLPDPIVEPVPSPTMPLRPFEAK